MAGFDHSLHHPSEAEDPATIARNSRRGLMLFAVYLVFYVAFVLLSAFGRSWMDQLGWFGVNVAVWYGFALIAGALVLALVYAWLCRSNPGSEGPE